MSTRLQRMTSRVARRAIRRYGDHATRIRPVESDVNGQTSVDLTAKTKAVRVVIAAKSGDLVEQGWGQQAAGDYMALVEPDELYQAGDLIDLNEGAWEGERLRVTFVDRLVSAVILERVHKGND